MDCAVAPNRASCRRGRIESLSGSVAIVPVLGMILLPKCPFCLAAYLATLSSFGLTLAAAQLQIVLVACLAVAMTAMGMGARRHRRYGPFALGLSAATAVVVGWLWLDSRPVLYAATAVLVAASLWSRWPRVRSGPLGSD